MLKGNQGDPVKAGIPLALGGVLSQWHLKVAGPLHAVGPVTAEQVQAVPAPCWPGAQAQGAAIESGCSFPSYQPGEIRAAVRHIRETDKSGPRDELKILN